MGKAYRSELLEVLHGMAEDLHGIGAIDDARMEEHDKNCLAAVPDTSPKTRRTRVAQVTGKTHGRTAIN